MKRVFVCSPYRASATRTVAQNEDLARRLCASAMSQGYAPFAPHLLYPQFLDEAPSTRALGIAAGKRFLHACDELWAFTRYGITEGMKLEIEEAQLHKIRLRLDPGDWVALR